jgi:uncharacterized protein
MIAWGLAVGFLLQGAGLMVPVFLGQSQMAATLGFGRGMKFLSFLAPLLVSLGFVSGLVMLCQRPAWQRRLAVFAPAGRMTLTNYLLQSVLGWAVFFGSGLGLYLQVGPALSLPIALGLCTFKLAYSAWWLRHFRMGPLEWVWRWAVQGKRPVLGQEAHPEAVVAGSAG